ncbi:MAG TPA: hypothetical protein VG055_29805 [Planctomycetaceae bacterium]|jgi:hypothetical protein|nr:hypothetical protein [Planctomycetaceae bacterium]
MISALVWLSIAGTAGQTISQSRDANWKPWRIPTNDAANCLYLFLVDSIDNMTYASVVREFGESGVRHSANDIVRVAKRFGANAELRSLTPGELWNLRHPAIVYLENDVGTGEFAVACPWGKLDTNLWLVISGGDLQMTVYSEDTFRRRWSGFAVLVRPLRSPFPKYLFGATVVFGYILSRMWVIPLIRRLWVTRRQSVAAFSAGLAIWCVSSGPSAQAQISPHATGPTKPSIPPDIADWLARSESGLLPLEVSWKETVSANDTPDLRLVKRQYVHPGKSSYVEKTDGKSVYFLSDGPNGTREIGIFEGVVFDGSRLNGKPYIQIIQDVDRVAAKEFLRKNHQLVWGSYFRAAGLFSPKTCDDFLQHRPVRWLIADLLDRADRSTDLGKQDVGGISCRLIELHDGHEDIVYRFAIDLTRPGVIPRHEERTPGGIVEIRYTCSDFVALGTSGLHLPQKCIAEHSIWGPIIKPQPAPIVQVGYVLEKVGQNPLDDTTFRISYSDTPGVNVSDFSSSEAKASPSGEIRYKIPPSPIQIQQTIEQAIRQAKRGDTATLPGRADNRFVLLIIVNVTAAALVIAILVWRKLRSSK